MRVAAVAHRYPPERTAGAESHLHAMLRALAARGHDVDVVVTDQSGDPYHLDGVAVWRDDPAPLVRVSGADRIVTHLNCTPGATAMGRFNRIPTVVVHHNSFTQAKEALHYGMTRVDLVAANSAWVAEDLAAWHTERDLEQPETIVCRPIADPADWATTPGDRVTLVNLRKATPATEDSDGLSKGGELFAELAARMPDTGFLGVVGAYGDQQDVAGLANVDLVDHVAHGDMRDRVYARTRILLVPSNYESWGRVASEAMCSGIPVVAHPTPGLVEQLGPAGIFVDRADVDGWVAALRRLADPDEWAEASTAARARAEQLAADDDLARWVDAVENLTT